MSRQTKKRIFTMLILTLVAGALFLTVASAAKPAGREIVLVSRDMAFYLLDDTSPNPTLAVAPGETIRLTLINRDRGFRHDWGVGAWNRATRLIPGDGSRDSIVFRAPNEPGDHEYVCSSHAMMMRGRIEVR